jgi:exopolysaccharide production protein ExoY
VSGKIHTAHRIPLRHDRQIYHKVALKRAMDCSIALVALLLMAPIMISIYLLIRFGEGGPALFKQQRVGLGGRMFGCYKFRSMLPNAEAALQEYLDRHPEAKYEWETNHKLVKDPRVTALGQFLRKSSLDELPQLWNVVVGDMSIVGPRPIVPAEMPRYGSVLGHYCSVRTGLTGLWQVSGRSDCTYPERVALDARYVEEWTLGRDFLILIKTIPAIARQRGSY